MRNARSALAMVLLLIAQLFCVLPGQGQPTVTPGTTASPREVTAVASPGESVGTIDLMNSQVETGPPDNLHFLEGQQDFYNGDSVRVTAGGKGKLTLEDGSFLTLFNETEIGGVNVHTSPPETDLFLQNGGFLGHVPPGQPTTVTMPNDAKITILGTYFFVVFNRETQVATAGNFDGLVNYTPPGGTEQELPRGQMVNLPPEGGGEVIVLPISFSHEQFEEAVDGAGTPIAGLNVLVEKYQIEPVIFDGQEVARMTHDTYASSAAFSPDGRYVVSGGCDLASDGCQQGSARVWEASTGIEVVRMVHESLVYDVTFSSDGAYVASGSGNSSSDETARVWEVATGREVARMTHDQQVISVDFSPDGRYLVSGSWDDTARVWEVATGLEVARQTHEFAVDSVDFSPDGRYVVSGGGDGIASVMEAATGVQVARLTHEYLVNVVSFSPDSRFVLSGSCDSGGQFCAEGTARVWDLSTGSEVARLTHEGNVFSAAFSPDGRYVVSGSGDEGGDGPEGIVSGSVFVWEAATGKEITRIPFDTWVRHVAFSPDGKYVVSGSDNGAIRVWDAFSGREVARMSHDDQVTSVAFSPDGRYLVSSSADGTARVWLWQPICQVGC